MTPKILLQSSASVLNRSQPTGLRWLPGHIPPDSLFLGATLSPGHSETPLAPPHMDDMGPCPG